jgi:metal-responsive CopG/Arc/MetJ family transcriptional regulator
MTSRVEKVTVSLPRDLVRFADEVARETKTNRSRVVSSCLREHAERRLRERMEQGYKAMAEENREFAKVAADLAHEVVPEWE